MLVLVIFALRVGVAPRSWRRHCSAHRWNQQPSVLHVV